MALVLGVDSSTQSTKALLVDADTGRVVATGRAPHPAGTEVDPRAWLTAVDDAAGDLLPRAAAVAVGGQQHGMVALDQHGSVVRDALLWNDTRSAAQAQTLVAEMGGPEACVAEIGYVLVASMTSTKLRWMAEQEPENAARTASVLLPHDYVSRHLCRDGAAFTDRGDASGTGYYSTRTEAWNESLVELAIGHPLALPEVAPSPHAVMGHTAEGAVFAPGTGDNMAAALGLSLEPGDVSVSIGTSGVAAMVSDVRPADPSGTVTGFADATGRFLPMATTMNAARVLDFGCRMLGVNYDGLSDLALASRPGAGGVVLLPYLDGERTPNRPGATGVFSGLTSETTRADIARACVEGLLASLADAVGAVEQVAGRDAQRILLIGGGAMSEAVRLLAPTVFGRPVVVPLAGEYVALGAARQAAWALSGADEPPVWAIGDPTEIDAPHAPHIMETYRLLKSRTADW
ncbi:xylulokinase [Tessaracoccus antarcticus]|uniref:Xylulose kinase n=1 Tax=Tessaracoccus antarcticus TaxID=2479848 RepID=A0A3M0G8N1_9ACTN|nr:xylulokinase [Tessaracoccus antarcticus]RMB61274.1 xylulokinase [Tessaracoccus antarcticus]